MVNMDHRQRLIFYHEYCHLGDPYFESGWKNIFLLIQKYLKNEAFGNITADCHISFNWK